MLVWTTLSLRFRNWKLVPEFIRIEFRPMRRTARAPAVGIQTVARSHRVIHRGVGPLVHAGGLERYRAGDIGNAGNLRRRIVSVLGSRRAGNNEEYGWKRYPHQQTFPFL